MALISDKLKNIFKERISQVIDEFGINVELIMPEKEEDCPNCIYDGKTKRSKGYDETNPYDEASGLNKLFSAGQVCPVCNGRGKLTYRGNNETIKCTVQWSPKDYETYSGLPVNIPADIFKCKTYSSNYTSIKNAIEFIVNTEKITETNINTVKCVLDKPITPRGLADDKYFIQFYLKRK